METKKVGRKPTGRIRNKNFSIKCTAEERELIINFLRTKGRTLTDGLLETIKDAKFWE